MLNIYVLTHLVLSDTPPRTFEWRNKPHLGAGRWPQILLAAGAGLAVAMRLDLAFVPT